MSFDRAADLIRQAALGLAHAHGRNLIHGGIRPAALLLSSEGVLKILDLGMAQWPGGQGAAVIKGGDQRLAEIDAYAAPEQLRGDPSADRRADIYSLGCTLYFLLTGRVPLPRDVNPGAANQGPRPISSWRPAVPQELVAVCDKMMAYQPERRYQTADELAEAIAVSNRPKIMAAAAPETSIARSKTDGWSSVDVQTEDLPTARESHAEQPSKVLGARWRLLLVAVVVGGIILLGAVAAYFY
jgi:serine/threonine protein kinase